MNILKKTLLILSLVFGLTSAAEAGTIKFYAIGNASTDIISAAYSVSLF